MPHIDNQTRLEQVEHILGSGTGTLDFAVKDESEYYTWIGNEDSDWQVNDIDSVENVEEDRFVIYPEGEYFTCDISMNDGGTDTTPIRCWCE